jgi:hypothetical protein
VPYSSLDNPQSLNLYGYGFNNPLSKAGPDGHCSAAEMAICHAITIAVANGMNAGEAMWAAAPAQQSHIEERRCIANCGKQPQSPLLMGGVAVLANEELGPVAWIGGGVLLGAACIQTHCGTAILNLLRSNPFRGTPGGTSQTNQPDGSPKQVRRYGPDGMPETDVDNGHDHGQGDPHTHDWGRPTDGSDPTHADRGRAVRCNRPILSHSHKLNEETNTMTNYDQFHDGWLDGLLIEQASVQVFISTEEKQSYVIAASGVAALSADGFKAGNIIFEILTKQQDELTLQDITESYGLTVDVNGREQAQKLLAKARERGLTVLQINPSYGGMCILLAESIDLLPRSERV